MAARLEKLFSSAVKVITQIHREKSTGMLEFELKELENIFALLILGGFAGLPSPPSPIAVELLPYMERELTILLARTDMSHDPLGALMGMLEID